MCSNSLENLNKYRMDNKDKIIKIKSFSETLLYGDFGIIWYQKIEIKFRMAQKNFTF